MKKQKSIYKTQQGKAKVWEMYDEQLKRLDVAYLNKWISTSFGKTHIVETGNIQGIPLLVFHGGNATSAYNLLACNFLFDFFHIYAVDTIGHPGKSAETSLSAKNYDYGKWASEVISAIGYDSIRCFGGSYGAGIIVKTMCVAPDKIKKAVLYVPSGIKNASAINSISMMIPMIIYCITHKESWLKKCMLPMAVTEDNITEDIYKTAKCSIDFCRIKSGMPSDVPPKYIKKCKAPTLVMAAEKDCLFPAKRVIPQAEKIITNCTTYLITDRGHMNNLSEKEKKMIIDFLI